MFIIECFFFFQFQNNYENENEKNLLKLVEEKKA